MRKAANAGNAAQFGMPFSRANDNPATHSTSQPPNSVARKPDVLAIALILASAFCAAPLRAADPPPNLAKLVAERETATEKERAEYTYRQSVTIDELENNGATRGTYQEKRDIIFSPEHERIEQMVGHPINS